MVIEYSSNNIGSTQEQLKQSRTEGLQLQFDDEQGAEMVNRKEERKKENDCWSVMLLSRENGWQKCKRCAAVRDINHERKIDEEVRLFVERELED